MRPTVERDPINELLDAVNLLTKPNVSIIKQENDDLVTLTRVELPGYLAMLRNAISSTVGPRAIGGALPNQRSVLDSDALERYENLSKSILARFRRISAADPFPTPEQNLRQWYIAYSNDYRAGKIHEKAVKSEVIELESWISAIDEKLNPPTTFDVPKPCPKCGETWIARGGESMQAVQVQYREAPDKSLAATKAICRGCDAVWTGNSQLRQLVYDIDQNDTINQEKEG